MTNSPRQPERDLRRRVRALIAGGFMQEPEAAKEILRSPWAHVLAWLTHDFPASAQLRALLFHLRALSEDRFHARQFGGTFGPAEYDALARQLANFLAERLQALFTRNRALEALFHREYDRGLAHIEEPREVARLLGLLQIVETHIPWTDVAPHADLEPALEGSLRGVDDPAANQRDAAVSAQIIARLLRNLAALWNGTRAALAVPLAGNHPGVVRLTLACSLAPPAEHAASGHPPNRERDPRRIPADWSGLPAAADVSDGLPDLLSLAARLLPEHASALQRVHLLVGEDRHRPLDRAVRLMAGRSWELGGLLALLSALSGVLLDRTAATGQINATTGHIEPVAGIDEKIDALWACRHPSRGPTIDRLFCPAANVGAAERATRRLGWDLEIRGLTAVDELLEISGPDPWADYCDALVERAEAGLPKLDVPAALSESLADLLDGDDERVTVLPAPFGVEPELWCMQVAAELARARLLRLARDHDHLRSGARGGVPVIVPADPAAATFSMLIGDTVRQVDPQLPELVWANQWQMPDGFVLIHADPHGFSPVLAPTSRDIVLSRKHPAMRHRFCFVAAHLHQLQEWRANPILARL